MRDYGSGHRQGRNSRSFEEHKANRGGANLRRGVAWLFYDAERREAERYEPHFRATARTGALDAKHMRSVRRPDKAAHVKDV